MSRGSQNYPDPLPFWFLNTNEKSLLGAKDLVILFGYKNVPDFHNARASGNFPEPDQKYKGHTPSMYTKCHWKKSTIVAEIERRKMLAKESA